MSVNQILCEDVKMCDTSLAMSYYSAGGHQFACVDLEDSISVIDPEHLLLAH